MLKHNILRYIPYYSSELPKPPATVPKFNSSNILEISVTFSSTGIFHINRGLCTSVYKTFLIINLV